MLRQIPWREICKFLAGAFFVSAGVLAYLYFYRVPVPIFATGLVETPEMSGGRAIVHSVFFVIAFYFGFMRAPKPRPGA